MIGYRHIFTSTSDGDPAPSAGVAVAVPPGDTTGTGAKSRVSWKRSKSILNFGALPGSTVRVPGEGDDPFAAEDRFQEGPRS